MNPDARSPGDVQDVMLPESREMRPLHAIGRGDTRIEGRGAARIRTGEWRFCKPLPYHLATAPSRTTAKIITIFLERDKGNPNRVRLSKKVEFAEWEGGEDSEV